MCPMREITMEVVAGSDTDDHEELEVTFFPPLNLQRRIWILNILRRDNITKVLDIGCGEGELLNTLCQVAPWLPPPPSAPESDPRSPVSVTSPVSAQLNPTDRRDPDSIPNLHPRYLHGLDISAEDLQFAVRLTKPPDVEEYDDPTSPHPARRYSTALTRFEELDVKIWKGGLEAINDEFVGMECIVSSEVIEHLPPMVLPFFAPVILGVYHPGIFLMTTPSYTYNARFTAPDAPSFARKGYPDPTKRTDRIFRHDDHKFEWETDEFEQWVNDAAATWGYSVHWASIGRSEQKDPYGREDELGGASFVAEFRKLGNDTMTDEQRGKLGRETVKRLTAEAAGAEISSAPHELLAHQHHPAHPSSQKPRALPEIAKLVKARMEDNREAIKGLEEVWYETGVAVSCGGWLEVLVQAIEESTELVLKKDEDGVPRKRDLWSVELIDADWNEEETSEEMPLDWIPGEGSLELTDYSDVGDSTGVEADVSLSEEDSKKPAWAPNWASGTDWGRKPKRRYSWAGLGTRDEDSDSWTGGWGTNSVNGGWGAVPDDQKKHKRPVSHWGAPTTAKKDRDRNDGESSTAGWDGDADSDTE
ncbi:hypothetical protein BKA70DRAFT_1149051 [Coprinopsis sp. MPI-PUGE-AT-0042]|nr:hypothetical protein BKA70DRAFT_1149051 [Coprinopsis sp. MPI-PUGE-AT-0042]